MNDELCRSNGVGVGRGVRKSSDCRYFSGTAIAAATIRDVVSRGCGSTASEGSVVNTTKIESESGSAQQSVPVDPLCPNVLSLVLDPLSRLPRSKPSPRGRSPGGF